MTSQFSFQQNPQVKLIFDALTLKGEETRIIGGAVRNALMGRPVKEIDFATTLHPNQVIERAQAAGLKAIPTGITHGTITLVCSWQTFEVTTLRLDVDTDGRHATVRFGRDWNADARRRDFTINALSIDQHGTLYDPVGGGHDIQVKRLRFIGRAPKRIREDYLRILRFFRLWADLPGFTCTKATLTAIKQNSTGLNYLSAERKWQELDRLLTAPQVMVSATRMHRDGIWQILLAKSGIYLDDLARLIEIEQTQGLTPSAIRRLGAIGCKTINSAENIAAIFNLSKVNSRQLKFMVRLSRHIKENKHKKVTGAAVFYRYGLRIYYDALALAHARDSDDNHDQYVSLYNQPNYWGSPEFPITGNDLTAQGLPQGPEVGRVMENLQMQWIKSDFTMGRCDLLDLASKLVN